MVGLNCGRGPSTMMPLLRECRKVCKVSGDNNDDVEVITAYVDKTLKGN